MTMTETIDDSTRRERGLSFSSILALLTLAAAPLLFATGWTSYAFFKRDVLVALAAVTLLGWGVEVLRERGVRLGAPRALAAWGLFALLGAISSFWSPSLLAGVADASTLVAGASLALVLAAPARARLEWHHVAGALGAGAALSGLFGLLDAAGVSLFTTVWDPPGPTGSFDSSEFATSYYALALPALAASVAAGPFWSRIVAGSGVVLGGVHLALVGSSTMAAVAMGVGMVAAALPLILKRSQTGGIRPLAYLAAAAVLAASVLGPAMFAPKEDPYNPATSLPILETRESPVLKVALKKGIALRPDFAIMRYETAIAPDAVDYVRARAIEAGREEAVLGQGAAGFWGRSSTWIDMNHPFTRTFFDTYPAFRSTHSTYLKTWAEQGGIGIVLLLLALLTTLGASLSLATRAPITADSEHGTKVWAILSLLFTGVVAMAFLPLLEAPASAIVWCGALGWMAGFAARHIESSWTRPVEVSTGRVVGVIGASALAVAMLVLSGVSLFSGYHRGAADQFMLYGRYEKARPAYDLAHDAFPAYGEDIYNSTLAAKRSGQEVDVLEAMDRALVLRPHDARLHHMKGTQHMSNRRFISAAESEVRAIRYFPHHLDAYTLLAAAQDQSTKMPDAAKTFEAALALDPPVSVRRAMARSLAQIYEGPLSQPQKALKWYTYALEYTNDVVAVENLRTRVEELSKRVERERLAREGKPVPVDLMPSQEHDVAGEIMGLPHQEGDGHDH